jgi:hypothetical protein
MADAALDACRDDGEVIGTGRGVPRIFAAAAGEAKEGGEQEDQGEVARQAANADEQRQRQESGGPDEIVIRCRLSWSWVLPAGVVEDVVCIDHELGGGGSVGREREQAGFKGAGGVGRELGAGDSEGILQSAEGLDGDCEGRVVFGLDGELRDAGGERVVRGGDDEADRRRG